MSLNMYIGEVQVQTESMNAFCNATIQGMEEVIRSIDAFALDVMLQGKTYDSAKTFFVQTYRQLAQGMIYLCEELIRQNNAFPADFQAEVATVDVIEQEIREQIRELERMIAAIEAMSESTPGTAAMLQMYHAMKRKLEDKLERLYQFNTSSSDNYSTAIQLAANIAKGLAEVQSGKGFSPASGTFSTKELNMDWSTSIQKITEDKAHKKTDAGIGATGEITNKVDLQSITDLLSTKSKEGYLYNQESGPLYAKVIGGELKAGAIVGGSAAYNTVKVGINGSVDVNGVKLKGETSLSMANAEAAARIDQDGFEIGAEASLAKYEASIGIPIPFTDHDLHIGGSASLGQVGGTVNVSSSGFKVNLPWGPGASPVGTGVEIQIK